MRYRMMDSNGDYLFGSVGAFFVDSPEAVAQAILTRLKLWAGEWFLDTAEGTPYNTAILGYGTQGTRDIAIKERILNTPGVTGLVYYYSNVSADRRMTVSCRAETQYGVASVNTTL